MVTIADNPMGTPCWFDLMTNDVPTARRFYQEVFHWDYHVKGEEAGFYSVAKVQGRDAAGMGQKPANMGPSDSWVVYMGVPDIRTSCNDATNRGASLQIGPVTMAGNSHLALLKDVTGATYGLWQPDNHPGFQVKGEHGSFAWCEVYSRDLNKTRDFYSEHLGLSHNPLRNMNITYTVMSKASPAFGIMQMGDEFGNMAPHWMSYFTVNNADETAEVIKHQGGSIAHGPFDSPLGRMAVCCDPGGAWFSILVPKLN